MFCRVRLFVHPAYLPGYYPYLTSFVAYVQHRTLSDKFCEFCNICTPLPDISVRFVRTSHPYPGIGYLIVEIPGGVLRVLYNIIPYPTCSVSSVRTLYPTKRTLTLRDIIIIIILTYVD